MPIFIWHEVCALHIEVFTFSPHFLLHAYFFPYKRNAVMNKNYTFTARHYAERGYATVCRLSVRLSVQIPWSH